VQLAAALPTITAVSWEPDRSPSTPWPWQAWAAARWFDAMTSCAQISTVTQASGSSFSGFIHASLSTEAFPSTHGAPLAGRNSR
jgi:hypothetical protein